ncbi:MAG: phosphoglucosamine mutase [Pirellulales bacterium]|nr:phosphoglucosamine mutase [Pirellulales bacterium]
MPSEPIITVSGLRGIVGESLTPAVAARYALAFADALPPGLVVISHDARASAAELEIAIAGALSQAGFEVRLAGAAATPTLGILVRTCGAIGGIQISASHNPPQYNGMKLFSAAGRVLPSEEGATVLARYRELGQPESSATGSGVAQEVKNATRLDDVRSAHCEAVLQVVDVERIRAKNFRVLVDSNHGAGGPLAVQLLQELGCDVIEFGTQPDAQYEHGLEPTEENLESVMQLAREKSCDVTFCQDPDADRLAVIDQHGNYLGEELTLAMCVERRLQQQIGPIVVNCSSSRVTADLAQKYGAPYVRTKVGEANVVDQMLAENALLGGEGNGGVIDPRVGFVRDSFVGMAMILDAMSEHDVRASELAAGLPNYSIVKTKLDMGAADFQASVDHLQGKFADAEPSQLDGLRLDWPDRWLLVRASNTEPIVRLIAEAKSRTLAESLCKEAAEVLHSNR